jgi:hypothetical protein
VKLFNDFKRFFAIPLVVSIIFFTVGSCSNNDETNEEPTFSFVGTWAGTCIDEGIPINFEFVFNSDFIGATVIQFEMFDQTDIFSWTSTDT